MLRRQIGYSFRSSCAADRDEQRERPGTSLLEIAVDRMRPLSLDARQVEYGPEWYNSGSIRFI